MCCFGVGLWCTVQHLIDFQLVLSLFDHVVGETKVQLVRLEGRQALTELDQDVVSQLHVVLRGVFSWKQASQHKRVQMRQLWRCGHYKPVRFQMSHHIFLQIPQKHGTFHSMVNSFWHGKCYSVCVPGVQWKDLRVFGAAKMVGIYIFAIFTFPSIRFEITMRKY